MQILLVDDSDVILRDLQTLLTTNGYHCLTAHNGQEALAALEAQEVDLIITDYNMPVMDGMAFCEELRRREVQVPIVMLTTEATRQAKQRAKELGVKAWIVKPFQNEPLLATLEVLTRSS